MRWAIDLRVLGRSDRLHMTEFARLTGLHPAQVARLVALGLVDPHEDGTFDAAELQRWRRMDRLRRDLGLNLAACGLVMDLLDRIDVLERELRRREIDAS